ncbi:hypothetical protein EYC80_000318 [Monilinia laxa]|uniref:Uncharacterized protein n=1 Tax=Monilinia laxa TaxID=61186 RepID=A0A5N6KA71_MONLA|nr:hypothetical protein EYC80_000318 [Monilinia laxa]
MCLTTTSFLGGKPSEATSFSPINQYIGKDLEGSIPRQETWSVQCLLATFLLTIFEYEVGIPKILFCQNLANHFLKSFVLIITSFYTSNPRDHIIKQININGLLNS